MSDAHDHDVWICDFTDAEDRADFARLMAEFAAEPVSASPHLDAAHFARVADDRMPRSALGARVGRVIAIAPIEQVPLARRIEVEPIAEAREATSAVVVMEAGAQPSDASANTPISGGRR